MKKRKITGRLFVVCLLTLFMLTCANSIFASEKEEKEGELFPIKIAFSLFQDCATIIVGQEMGYFAEVGLKPEIIPVHWPEAAEMLGAGVVDFANVGDDDIVSKYDKMKDMRFSNLLFLWEADALIAQKDTHLKTFDDFKAEGMSDYDAAKATCAQLTGIITPIAARGTAQERFVATCVNFGGIDYKKEVLPKLLDMGEEEGLPVFLGGDGDIFSPGIPQQQLLSDKGYPILIRAKDLPIGGAVSPCGFGTTKEFAEKHFDEVVKFQAVIYKSLKYIDSNWKEGFTIICDYLNERTAGDLTPEILKTKYWNVIEFFPLPEEAYKNTILEDGSRYWKTRWEASFKYFFDRGMIHSKPERLEDIVIWPRVLKTYLQEYEPELWEKLKVYE